MNHTAKIDPIPSYAADDDAINEVEPNEAAGMVKYDSDPNYLTDAEILDDGFLDGYEELDAADGFDEQLSFVRGED